MAKRARKSRTVDAVAAIEGSMAPVEALVADPDGTVALVASGALDARLEPLAARAAAWSCSPVLSACWERQRLLAADDG